MNNDQSKRNTRSEIIERTGYYVFHQPSPVAKIFVFDADFDHQSGRR